MLASPLTLFSISVFASGSLDALAEAFLFRLQKQLIK